MKPVAVILSGCGVQDGSEVHESVLALLALSQQGAEYICIAPNIPQTQVVNHFSHTTDTNATRNCLEESARIGRSATKDIAEVNPEDFSALIVPGGFGAALNLSNFGIAGAACVVNPLVEHFIKTMIKAGKPAGFICVAPHMISKLYGPGVKHTIGDNPDYIQRIADMGGLPVSCSPEKCVVDIAHKVVSTPAYMVGKNIAEIAIGIEVLVKEILNMISNG